MNTFTVEDIKKNFDNFVDENNRLYTVTYSHPVLKTCFKDLPDSSELVDLVKKMKEYLPNIQCTGTRLMVDIDEKFISHIRV